MALIKCEECGNEISDKALSCPKCGAPRVTEKKNLVKCQKCGSEINDKILSCPKCGAPRSVALANNQSKNSGCLGSSVRIFVGVIVGFFGLVILIIILTQVPNCDESTDQRVIENNTSSNNTQTEKPRSKHDEISAWVYCQAFVKEALRSPGSADFGGLFSGEYQRPAEHAKHLGDGVYECKGWVDSQNSFGAKVRNRFSITIKYTEKGGEEGWQLVKGPELTAW